MRWLLPLFSFLLVAFGQPASIRGLGVLSAAFGFALFWKGMLSFPRFRDRFWLSSLWFTAVQAVQLSWMTTVDYMGPFILVLYAFLIFAMGIQFGLLSFFLRAEVRMVQIFALAGSWTLLEWTRLFFLCGFSWNPVGLALADSSYAIQFAAMGGVFSLSFWVIFVNGVALKALFEPTMRHLSLWASLAFFPYLFGWVHQTWIESHHPPSKTLRVALVQTGLLPEEKEWSRAAPDRYILPLEQWRRILAVLDRKKETDLIVLPEAALPLAAHRVGYSLREAEVLFDSQFFPPLREPYAIFYRGQWQISNTFLLQTLSNQFGSHVIVGLDDADATGQYNAAFHFQPKNAPYERYEKRLLVPVGEYVPLKGWKAFSEFVGEQFGIYGSFDQGKEAKIFKAPIPIGISICLEETFGSLTRELRVKGAEIFVNLTNDAWFPRSKLPRQHFDHGRIRAAENGVCILRSCNTGITGGVDCFGSPMEILPVSEDEASALYLSVPLRSYATLYTWWGDFAILAVSLGSWIPYLFHLKKRLP